MSSTRQTTAEGRPADGLQRGSTGLERGQLADVQRARILAAMVEVVSERGVGNATVARVVTRSGVSRRTFYELFEDREDCFLATFEDAVRWVAAAVSPAYERQGEWRQRIRAGLCGLLQLLEYEPDLGRLLIVETLGAGPAALERRGRVLAKLIAIVDEGRTAAKTRSEPPSLAAEGVVGGVLSLIHSRMLEDDESLITLLNPLMAMIVLPYLGANAARRELAQPPAKAAEQGRRVAMGPLRDLEMRLTYRTMHVLTAIGAHPGASNRQVADSSGIRDQGQVSKLLARLEHLGLIRNSDEAKTKGEPNVWALTKKGLDVQSAISSSSPRRP